MKKKKYVVGWFVVGGGSGTLPKEYEEKKDGYDFAIELQKSADLHMRYFVKVADDD